MRAYAGYFWALTAVFFWGVMFPVGRSLMTREVMEPSALAMTRFLIAAPILFALGAVWNGRRMLPQRGRDWFLLAFFGLTGSALMAELLFIAQRTVLSLNASLLEAYVPIQVLLLGLLTGKRLNARQTIGVALGFIGSMLILQAVDGTGFTLGTLSLGDLLIFLSGLCWSVYTAWGRPLAARLGGFVFTAWTVLFGGLWLLAYNLCAGVSFRMPTNGPDWGRVLFLAVCPTAISFFGWNEAQKTVSLARLSFMEYFTPLVAALFGFLFLGEPVTIWQGVGIALVIFSARLHR